MGLMDNNLDAGRLIMTPHPVLLDGQTNIAADLRPGESLYAFLHRHVDGLDGQQWHVAIGGRAVPRHMWHHVRPKHGQVIEVRGGVAKTALLIVALIALTVFTAGVGTAMVAAGYTAVAAGAAQAAIYMAGSLLINKVLGPKPDKPKNASTGQNVYSLSAPRNQLRPYEPLGLLLGSMRIAPDLASNAYTWYEGDDQYLALILTPGINVNHVDELYNGDALLSSFEGVQAFYNGFPGMPSEEIPLYSNADVIDGGTLLDTGVDPKHTPGPWIQRTGAADTIKLMVGIEFTIYDRTSKGGDKANTEQIQIQYRATGSSDWQVFGNYTVSGSTPRTRRVSYTKDVPAGQYDVRVRTAGLNTNGSGAQANFTWATLTSVQQDEATYAGIPRIGVRLKATGQLNGAPNEIRCVAHSVPIPVWNGGSWVTQESSNPGAQILAYARGFTDSDGRRIAGIGLPDAQIDMEALKAFTLHCAANGFTYNNWITDVRSHDDVLNAIALAGFGQISWASGRLSVIWAADEQPLSGVVNMATIKKGQFQVDYTLANAADGIEYSYLDGETWEAKTLRVPAPGVTTMLNPAQISGEGVTSEDHAAQLARWHLAQSLYQYKSISYSTDIEHLSYRRMSLLALQHDLTQWGYGGRVMAASIAAGVVTLELDEEVPAPAAGSAFIGLRIPGERVYRVMQVRPFTGTSRTLQLVEDWPADAALPGSSSDNPAWDTIWIYDFKQTPGYRVRVTGIQPESDLKGAAVTVVAEGPEFWHYVKTGEYIPAPNQSLLQTRPVASDLRVTERQVVQGDTVFTELQASWTISGPVGNTVVLSDVNGDAELDQVASTVTRSASWRIPGAGTYAIVVRPYNPDGMAGVAASILYTTSGADAAPVLVDLFDVEELSGGVRRYTWGFFTDTIQSADFAGVEIRYTSGLQSNPVWDAMTPLGNDGVHAVAFESVIPGSGDWTFACRSRNAAGTLSTGMRVVQKTLGKNLGEIQQEQQEQIDQNTQQILDNFNQLVAEQQALLDQINAQAQELAQQAIDLANLQAAIDAPDWDAATAYTKGQLVKSGGHIFVAKQDVPAGTALTDTAFWEDIGEYATLAEAVGAISVSVSNLSNEVTALDGEVTALATSVDGVASELASKADASAVEALSSRVSEAEGEIEANSELIGTLQAAVAGKADASALNALATRVTAAEDAISVNSSAITQVRASINTAPNLLKNPTWSNDKANWSAPATAIVYHDPTFGDFIAMAAVVGGQATQQDVVGLAAGRTYTLSGECYRNSADGVVRFEIAANNATSTLASQTIVAPATPIQAWQRLSVTLAVPAGTTYVRVRCIVENTTAPSSFRRCKLEDGATATLWSDETSTYAQTQATNALQTTVTQQGNTLSAQGSALTNVSAQLGSNPNLLPNGGFKNGLVGWNQYAGFAVATSGVWGVALTSGAPALPASDIYSDPLPVAGTAQWTFSGDAVLIATTGWLRFDILFYDAANNVTGVLFGAQRNASFDFDTTGGNRQALKVSGTAPAGTTYARVRMAWGNVSGLAGIGFRNMKFERGLVATPYSEEQQLQSQASATQSLTARVTNTENGVASYNASWAVTLNANGYVTGVQSVNNGVRGTFTILADVFNIVAPGGGARTEYSGGNWRTYAPNGALVTRMGVW